MSTPRVPVYDGVTILGTQPSVFPTMSSGDNSTSPASTAFVAGAVAAETSRATSAEGATASGLAAEITRATAAEALKATITTLASEATTARAAEQMALATAIAARTFIDVTTPPYNAVGDGTADASAAINAAASAAAAAGSRYLWFPRGLKFSAPSLSDTICRDAIFLGDGATLVNLPTASRKNITNISAPGPIAPRANYDVEKHTPLGCKAAVTVMYVGDSHAVWDANDIFTAPGLVRLISDAFSKANPNTAYTFLNYSIGGTNLANLTMQNNDGTAGWVPATYPTWWPNTSLTWLQTCQAQAPDIVVWIRCTNEIIITPGLLIDRAQSVLTTMNGWAKPPNHIMCIEPTRSLRLMPSPNVEEAAQMALRSFAQFFGFGLLDMARMGCMVRDGIDPMRGQAYLRASENITPRKTLPYVFPGQTRDYGTRVSDFGTIGQRAFSGAGGEFQFATSGTAGDVFRVGVDSASGCYYFQSDTAGINSPVTPIARTVTSVAATYNSLGTATIQFELYGNRVVCISQGTDLAENTGTIFAGFIIRFGGQFIPSVSSTTAGSSFLLSDITMSTSVQNIPTLTDTEFFGIDTPDTVNNYYGGDSGLHISTRAVNAVYHPVIAAADFRTPGDVAKFARVEGIKSGDEYVQLVGNSGTVIMLGHSVPGQNYGLYVDTANGANNLTLTPLGTGNTNLVLTPKGTGNVTIGGSAPLLAPAMTVSGQSTLAVIKAGGSLANMGGLTGAQIAATYSTDGSGCALWGWNYAGGPGETDLILNRGGGSAGGFNIYDIANSTHVISPLFSVSLSGGMTALGNAVLTSGAATAGGSIVAVTVASSPLAYTASARGTLYISAGAGVAISIRRGATTVPTGAIAGPIDVVLGDVVTVTYSTAPTVNFAPA